MASSEMHYCQNTEYQTSLKNYIFVLIIISMIGGTFINSYKYKLLSTLAAPMPQWFMNQSFVVQKKKLKRKTDKINMCTLKT